MSGHEAPLSHGRALPHSPEAERAVLASILLSPNILGRIDGRLGAEDFYLERHRLIYTALLELQDAGSEIDLRTVQGRLEQAGHFGHAGGLAYLAGLDLDLPDIGRAETYVDMVKERSNLRRLGIALSEVAGDCRAGSGVAASEALQRAESAVLEIGTELSRGCLTPLESLCEETLVQMEDRAGGELLGVSSPFPDWDRLSEGLVSGNLVIVAGRPGMGKTSFALDVARHVAIGCALPVAFFSLEMSRIEITQRLLSAQSGLAFSEVRAARLGEEQWRRLYATLRDMSGAPLYVDDTASPSVFEIASKARRLKAKRGLALVVIDYLQLLPAPRRHSHPSRHENRQQEVTALSRAFKVMAKELEVPVLLLSQLSRKPEERVKNHRPVLSDLRESGAIEQDADMVCFVYREEVYSKDDPDVKGLAELIVEKNRNGPTGTVELVFLGERATFMSRAR